MNAPTSIVLPLVVTVSVDEVSMVLDVPFSVTVSLVATYTTSPVPVSVSPLLPDDITTVLPVPPLTTSLYRQ